MENKPIKKQIFIFYAENVQRITGLLQSDRAVNWIRNN